MAEAHAPFRAQGSMGEYEFSLESGRIARQADGAVLVRQGDTAILVTVVAAAAPREGVDFFPLTVEYRERFSAVGRFPGGYRKREARSSDHEILSCRLIDRSLRPLFPEGFFSETQVLATVLSYEPGTDPEVLAITGASAALHISDIPFHGPVAGVRVARTREGVWTVFPTREQREGAACELIASLGPDGLIMIEGQASEVPEAELVEALKLAAEAVRPLHELQEKARAEAGVGKRSLAAPEADTELWEKVDRFAVEPMKAALRIAEKKARALAVEKVQEETLEQCLMEAAGGAPRGDATATAPDAASVDGVVSAGEAQAAAALAGGGAKDLRRRVISRLHELEYKLLRASVLDDGVRADGRKPTEIRPIRCEAPVLPRVHGSALFTRGETQALVVATLGTGRDEQEVETLDGVERERFQLFYNFPPYAVGETKPVRGPGRREIGHGNLARRALEAVLPGAEDFPYTIKVESEITESNGSSSMASVCGGCLALMDAGVPVKRPVAGIAMGLIQEGERAVVLSDILGVEDHLGDMDFKVAGSSEGVTAVQLDNKVGSLPFDLLERALAQAREGRLHILAQMAKALDRPRKDLSLFAPRIAVLTIGRHRIRDLIGPGGRTIQELQADTNTKIDVNDDGRVRIYAVEAGALPYVKRRVWELTGEPEVGKIYRGTITGVKDFGCFVRIFQGIEGLVHVSELLDGHAREVGSVAVEGEMMVVKVLGVDGQGKIQLSRRAAIGASEAEVETGE